MSVETLERGAGALPAGGPPRDGGIMAVFGMIRYRFFLYAGLLPYLLGGAWAYAMEGAFDPARFWLGLLGIFFSVCGVEAFNEYYDARMGTDRVFNPSDDEVIGEWMRTFGVVSFGLALACGLALAWDVGWPILVYTGLGGLAAIFYVGPPIRWVYRGLGETMIGLSYGPWMTLGSVHLHTGAFSWGALAASLVPGLLIASLAVVNAIPDYYQDRLVGKRNLVVRLGRRGGAFLYIGLAASGLAALALGAAFGVFPKLSLLAAAAGAPLVCLSAKSGLAHYEEPRRFVPAVKWVVLAYVAATGVFTLALALA
ncbi:MAG: prenyltransferase [Elusimicrobia bacterium]|nr:prenyltransferase [Elusimicrobiota bacterium]